MRELGCGILLSALFTWALHFTLLLPWMTADSWILHPYLPIHLKNIHKAKHGSDTEVFDEEGRFLPQVRAQQLQRYVQRKCAHSTHAHCATGACAH